jgi:ATP-dependent DNA helicase RecG
MNNFIFNKESENIEFKKSVAEWKAIIKTACAFSNTSGGQIIVGILNSGKIVGVDVGKDTIEDLTNKIINNTDPKVYPKISVKEIEKRNVIFIKVNESYDKTGLAFGIPYERVGKSTVKMSKEEYEKRILEKHRERLYFDSENCEGATLDDIDEVEIIKFLKVASSERGLDIDKNASPQEALMRLKLIRDRNLTNAAILLFGRNPQNFFSQSEVKCVRFKGNDITGEMIDLKPISGNIINQVTKIEKFIFDHISLSAWIEPGKIERQERWEYPPKAIREALVNAIVHRDYRSPSKVQVRIFDDRLEFWNPGRLPEGWTVETLKEKHESKPFNPLIAKIFFWIKYIEEVGTGTNKIIQWCKEWGLPEPDFEYTGTSLIVTLRKSKLTKEYLESLGLNEKQKKIVDHLKVHKKITSGDIQKMFNVVRITANRYIKSLIEIGVIERKGIGKGTYYILKIK